MTEVRPDPPNIPGEDDPPDVQLAILVAILILRDLRDYLDPGDDDDHDPGDLLLRTGAVLAVLRRLRDRLAEED